jgi:hypothetical protein
VALAGELAQLESATMSIGSIRTPQDEIKPARPRFGLQQVFVFIAVMAVILGTSQYGPLRGIEIPRFAQFAFIGSQITHAIVASLAITIVAYGIVWRHRGIAFFNEPGHWLLVCITASQMIHLGTTLAFRAIALYQGVPHLEMMKRMPTTLILLPSTLALVALNIYIARTKCQDSLWRRVFYAKAAAEVLSVFGELLVLLFLERAVRAENPKRSKWRQKAQRVQSVPPIQTDIRSARQRDAEHWCGVVSQFVISGSMAVLFLAFIAYFVYLVAAR